MSLLRRLPEGETNGKDRAMALSDFDKECLDKIAAIRREGLKIDPETAEVTWFYGNEADPTTF